MSEDAKAEDDFSKNQINNSSESYDKVVDILVEIHDKWVKKKEKKYDRGNEEKSDKNLFQHTPTALIGLDEVAKDLMFLAPFLKEMGLNAGEMKLETYGSFIPSSEVAEAYQRYVQKYMEENNIYSKEDLENHLKECINGKYLPLNGDSEMAMKRKQYMNKKMEKVVATVESKNPEKVGSLPSQGELA